MCEQKQKDGKNLLKALLKQNLRILAILKVSKNVCFYTFFGTLTTQSSIYDMPICRWWYAYFYPDSLLKSTRKSKNYKNGIPDNRSSFFRDDQIKSTDLYPHT